VKAIGYDMDYTLIHYHTEQWERRTFAHVRERLLGMGWPVEDTVFDPDAVMRGLIIDRELGNLVKANRFGYIKTVNHGTRPMDFDTQRKTYARTIVSLDEPRWVFLNTLFGLSEGHMYCQLVDKLDAGVELPGVRSYDELYNTVKGAVDLTHMEGQLKAEIIADPDRYVDLDPNVPLTLLDQKNAGKKLLLITNSGWKYSNEMMTYAFDSFLPGEMTWQDLFDITIVSARKPAFFSGVHPVYEVMEDGLLSPIVGGIDQGKTYSGGHASLVEKCLNLNGEQILYVGDHVYGDVNVSKNIRRWRTALVLRELEGELQALHRFQDDQVKLSQLMKKKIELERTLSQVRLQTQRQTAGYGEPPNMSRSELDRNFHKLRSKLTALDELISPLARTASELDNERWGLVMRTGNDKSHIARQVERHADIYTSRVSNFLYATPFEYFRSPRGSLPHDPGESGL
jgi:HAD superfamily 5'-nucleotidase-like hydrolase